jgi:hypothetical protein
MQTAILVRDEIRSDVILGTLTIANKTFHVLERPWKDNLCNESCIPAGEYVASFLSQSSSGKHKNIYQLQAVPNRSNILIHTGNVVEHSRGCLIIGLHRGVHDGAPAVLESRSALTELVDIIGKNNFLLRIIGAQELNKSRDSANTESRTVTNSFSPGEDPNYRS